MILNITANLAELEELKKLHQRATNTLEPEKWPDWVKLYDTVLAKSAEKLPGQHLGTATSSHMIVVTLVYP